MLSIEQQKERLVSIFRSCYDPDVRSQREFARTMKVKDWHIRKIEKGQLPENRKILYQLAHAISAHQMLGYVEEQRMFFLVRNLCESRRTCRRRFYRKLRRCTDSEARILLRKSK